MARTKLVATGVLCVWCAAMLSAQRVDPARTAIDAYKAAIQVAEKAPSHGRLEAAFDAIGSLRHALLVSRGASHSFLESRSEQEFAALDRELVGLVVTRDEAIVVEPDVAFFQRLAARGDPADRAFFAALVSTYPRSVWPVYLEQQTDVTGCTRFGSGTLVSAYFTWAAVRRQYPRRYVDAVGEHLEDIVKELTESTCACADQASVERELTAFSRRAPASDVRARVDARLAAVRSGRADIRFTCKSG
jgi:hypothetical protein